jgi:photosystem II stability/assembly factor-like uncharacterized protein
MFSFPKLTRETLALALISCFALGNAYGDQYSYTWKPLRIGAGGWVTGIDISNDGTMRVVRTDTYGAYVWDGTQWKQLVTAGRMPAQDVGVEMGAGVYEICVAPGDADRLYMSYRGRVYRSDDRGDSWTRTSFPPVGMDANDDYRMLGQKMAVDPANPDVVYAGTPGDGLYVTTDGGAGWLRVDAVPAGQQAGFTGIAFDPTSGTLGGRTRTVYAPSYGNGVWRTVDAGATWNRLAGGPDRAKHASVHIDGTYYVTGQDGYPNEVWRYAGGGWQNITPAVENRDWHSVSLDPFNVNRVVLAGSGGYITQTHDGGASWNDIVWAVSREATDIPWLAWTESAYMSNGDMRFDPLVPNKLWFSMGIGVFTTTLPANPSSITWASQSRGIEQLVATDITAPPGGKPMVAAWDRPLFYVDHPDVFPSQHGPHNQYAILMSWDVDYASSDPAFFTAIIDWWGIEESGYSTDGGHSWTTFPAFPNWPEPPIGGAIAASTPNNIVWVPSNRKAPYYTKDGGRTWQRVNLPGNPDLSDLHWAYYLNRHIVTADRVNLGTFYMYVTPHGLYRTTNGGDDWTRMYNGEIVPWSAFNAELKAVPGHAGQLYFTIGPQSGQTPSGEFMRSTDGGATWTAIPNVLEVLAFGFGKQPPGGSYPAIFIAGWVNNVFGIWRSDNEGQAWTQVSDFPLGSLDHIPVVEGDKNTYGKVYVGFQGSGYAYGVIGCRGDFKGDGDVDGSDLAVFAEDFGRTNCATGDPCEGDFDKDNGIDGSDLSVFAADFGRTDCW